MNCKLTCEMGTILFLRSYLIYYLNLFIVVLFHIQHIMECLFLLLVVETETPVNRCKLLRQKATYYCSLLQGAALLPAVL